MHYKACTTLKKVDAEGRIPLYTLDQYVRGELVQQLMKTLKPVLSIGRSDHLTSLVNPSTVEFTTELFILKSHQWQQLKDSLNGLLDALPAEQQLLIRRLMDEMEMTPSGACSSD